MKPQSIVFAVVVPVLVVSACSKDKEGEKPSADTVTKPKASEPAKAAGPDLSSWDQAGKAKAWQGSWLAKENGKIQAWTVTGDAVKTWDGTEEKSFTLVIDAPCRAGFKNDKSMIYPRNFTAVGGKLRFGPAGYRRGAEALFCDDSGDLYMLDAASKCTQWEKDFGDWKGADGECSIKTNADGVEVFAHGDPNGGEWTIEGDAILPRGSFPTEAVEGDFAAARAARDVKAAE